MTLIVDLRHRQGSFDLRVAFTSQGGVTALFGPSGCGKTTVLRAIAGLLKPYEGRIVLDGEILLDTAQKRALPTHCRRLGFVFQEPRLFPHLDVRQNLAYGQWFAGKGTDPSDLSRVASLLGLEALMKRQPARLSGGEKQRVAIGRALLSSPRMLLMDEPLSALDEARKAEILPYLERLRDELKLPILYVSHAVSEVARLADHVVALDNGHVTATGTASDILETVGGANAREAGSVLSGSVQLAETDDGIAHILLRGCTLIVARGALKNGQQLRIHIPAREVLLATTRPEGISALNILDAVILDIRDAPEGTTEISLQCGREVLKSRITSLSRERLGLMQGMSVFAIIKTLALASPLPSQ